HVEVRERSSAGIRDEPRLWVRLPDLAVPEAPELEQALFAPEDIGAARRVLRVVRARQIEAGRGLEARLAVVAVAGPVPRPAVAEDAVDLVARHDLARDFGHELEVVGAERAGHPPVRSGPVASLPALGVDGNPFGMSFGGIIEDRMRVGAGDHHHAELAATGRELAERVGLLHPGGAV